MTDQSHLYSCLISNRPEGGFFGSEFDTDGHRIGDFAGTEQGKERSDAAHRLVKAAKCPTAPEWGEKSGIGRPVTVAGRVVDADQLQRQQNRERLAALGDYQSWEALALIDYPADKLELLHYLDAKNGKTDLVKPLPQVDITRIGDDAEQTHTFDPTSGEIRRVRKHESQVKAVVERKDWADEFRIRTKVEQAITSLPPEQAGPRYTRALSLEGARKISESCRYMALKHQGFSTFLTLTLDDAARCRVEIRVNHGPCTELEYKPATKTRRAHYLPKVTHLEGLTARYDKNRPRRVRWIKDGHCHDMTFQTVQKELSRFWDAANKLYQRGWVEEIEGKEHRGQPHDETLQYCWVVENPKNERGGDNPHIHVLMKWRVPYRDFQAWAKRIEKVWGQGTGHLEKIKEPEKAGSYMAKAAGYLTKGENGGSDQGLVRGNRYGISRDARAPDWECVGVYENGIMGTLIRDVHDHFLFAHGPKLQQRNRLKELLEETPKEEKADRQRIGKALEKVRTELNQSPDIPHRPSRYQLVITGVHKLAEFFSWAKDDTGQMKTSWLPSKERGVAWSESERPAGAWYREWYQRISEQRRRIHSARADKWKGMCDAYWHAVRHGYEEPTEPGDSWEDYQLA